MSSQSLSNYLVPCLTEGVAVLSDYVSSTPTTCPHDVGHTIDAANIKLYSTIESVITTINQESGIAVGGFFRVDGFTITTPANSTSNTNITYPYNIGGYSVTLMPTSDNIGDECHFVTAPNTPVGLLTSGISTGATGLSIGSVAPLNPGFFISITDGVNTANLGEIISKDVVNHSLVFSTPSAYDFAASSVVMIGIPRVKNFKFVNDHEMPLGLSKIGSSGLPANTVVKVTYTNNGDHEKTFFFYSEIEY